MAFRPNMPHHLPLTQSKSGKPCCPKKVKNQWLDGTLNTNYKLEFVDKEVPLQVVGRNMQPNEWAPRGKFVDTTTFGEAFVARAVEPTSPFKPRGQSIEPQPFRGTSTHQDDFQVQLSMILLTS